MNDDVPDSQQPSTETSSSSVMLTRSSLAPASSDSMNDILLHPDALHCLKRKQLENLCARLDIESSGKKEELIARLEGYSSAKLVQAGSPTKGKVVNARPPRTEESFQREVLEEDEEEYGDENVGEGGLASAGPSIRLITKGTEEEDGVGLVSRSSSSRSILGEKGVNDNITAKDSIANHPTTKPIYPWKRISSSSLPKALRSSSSNLTVSSAGASAIEDDPMTLDEFGAARENDISNPNAHKGSLSGLKRWMSKSSASSKKDQSTEAVSAAVTASPPAQDNLPTFIPPPTPKRKREEAVEGQDMPGAFHPISNDSPEAPVKRVIKARPSRAAKQGVTSKPFIQAATSTPDTSNAATKVWEEMNARLKLSGKASMSQLPSENGWSRSIGLEPPASPLKSIDSRTKGRFSNEHNKHFGRMDSIVNHYAAKREMGESAREAEAESSNAAMNKRIKIAEVKQLSPEKSAEDRAAIHRKLEISRQRRKSVGRKATSARKSGGRAAAASSKIGLKGKISGAVKDFVGVARSLTTVGGSLTTVGEASNSNLAPQMSPLREFTPSKLPIPTNSPTKSASKRPTFDLQASLARKPVGYTPYSAKETVQMIQSATLASFSPPKAVPNLPPPSPIRSGWTMIPTPINSSNASRTGMRSTSSTIAFPCVSPRKESLIQKPVATAAVPSPVLPPSPSIRRNTLQTVPPKKTRSSISANQRVNGTIQGDRLKRAARANEIKHQASMAAKRRTGDAVQRAVARGEELAKTKELVSGSGRGSPRKASGKVVMEGEGRGAAGLK